MKVIGCFLSYYFMFMLHEREECVPACDMAHVWNSEGSLW